MKKLAVLMMMPALVMLLVPALTSADDGHYWGRIHGTYEMVATGTCLHSTGPFTFNTATGGEGTLAKPFVAAATPDGKAFSSSFLGEGIWTFDRNGEGTMQVMQYCILPDKVTQSLLPSKPLDILFGYTETVPFDYVVEGTTITVTLPAPVNLTLVGKISSDHKTLTLLSMMQEQNAGPTGHQVCNIGRILTRVQDVED